MQRNSTTDCLSLDDVIMACVEPVQGIAWKFVRSSSRVDFEEFCSIGMLAVCEASSFGIGAVEPIAYLCKCAKNAMIGEFHRLHNLSTTSLDAPLSSSSDDSTFCLADLLSAPAAQVAPASSKTRAVRAALNHVTRRQRAALRRRYGLPGYGVCSLKETARVMHTTVGSVNSAVFGARRALYSDSRLRKALNMEVEA
jgi:RNA polymerase sigma factor (sigma-70 family)